MKTAGFVVDPHFMTAHVGVRNYVLGLSAILIDAGWEVEFLSTYRSADGQLYWYRQTPKTALDTEAADFEAFWQITGSPRNMMKGYSERIANLRSRDREPVEPSYYTHFGRRLPTGRYELMFITAPWVDLPDRRLPAPVIGGLVHDLVPNKYALTKSKPDVWFAAAHRRGYEYYSKHCDFVLTNSPVSASEYNAFFRTGPSAVSLPPFPPAAYHRELGSVADSRAAQVILASPFDLRKGLRDMPALLSDARKLDRIFIYGDLRCAYEEAASFFDRLSAREVTWIPRATAKTVIAEFGRSKLMLFPSYDEGLGIPLIEAQWMGCRVAVRRKPPMSDLALSGAVFISAKASAEIVPQEAADLASALNGEGFNYPELARQARDQFAPELTRAALQASISTLAPAPNSV